MFTAVIRNMSFEREAFCKEIQTFKGVEAMIKVRVVRIKDRVVPKER